jgi:predicted dehydrogenase
MSEPFRLGIVGCGRISNAHALAALAHPTVRLAALVDPTPERARALAARVGAEPVIAGDLDQVLDRIDGAVIATPNHTHADIAVRCLERRIAVLIENPLAVSAADGERICASAEASGACLAVGYVTRFRENVRLMKRLLDDRAFGTVRRFAYQFGSRGGWAPVSGYNLDRKTSGGGVLVVTGTHFLDRMIDWFGDPDEASLVDDSLGGPEANAKATFRFDRSEGAIHGMARFSKSVALDAGIVIETSLGIVVLTDRPDAQIVFRPAEDPEVERVIVPRVPSRARAGGEFLAQLADFVEAAQTGRAPEITGRQGQVSLRLIERLYRHRTPMEPGAAALAGGRS